MVTTPKENALAPALVQRPRVSLLCLCSRVPCADVYTHVLLGLVLVLVLLCEMRARSLSFLSVKVVVRQRVANMTLHSMAERGRRVSRGMCMCPQGQENALRRSPQRGCWRLRGSAGARAGQGRSLRTALGLPATRTGAGFPVCALPPP